MRACSPGCVQSGSRVRVHSPQTCAAGSVVASHPSHSCQCCSSSCAQAAKWCSACASVPVASTMSVTLNPMTTAAATASAIATQRMMLGAFAPPSCRLSLSSIPSPSVLAPPPAFMRRAAAILGKYYIIFCAQTQELRAGCIIEIAERPAFRQKCPFFAAERRRPPHVRRRICARRRTFLPRGGGRPSARPAFVSSFPRRSALRCAARSRSALPRSCV